jgi:hypothetical protein
VTRISSFEKRDESSLQCNVINNLAYDRYIGRVYTAPKHVILFTSWAPTIESIEDAHSLSNSFKVWYYTPPVATTFDSISQDSP